MSKRVLHFLSIIIIISIRAVSFGQDKSDEKPPVEVKESV